MIRRLPYYRLVIWNTKRYATHAYYDGVGEGYLMGSDNYFIVIEGMDGSGKTGITRQLHAHLSQTYRDQVALTFEPHDPSRAGLYIRNVLTKRIKATPLALALAFALNRADHNTHIIDPFLDDEQPRIIICDRYTLSSLVYQSTDDMTMDDVYGINQWARRPDLTIFLDVSPDNCYERMRNRPQDKELFEKNLQHYLNKYREGIQVLRDKGETVVEVDANPTFPEVLASVLETIQSYAPDWLKVQTQLSVDEITPAESNLPIRSESELTTWVQSLTTDAIEALSDADVMQLFKAYVIAHGFGWGNQLIWTEAHAYELSYDLPLGIQQRGTALILNSSQQADLITQLIYDLIETTPDTNPLQFSDFMLVLDLGRFEPLARFERDRSSGRTQSPSIQIITRDTLAKWVADS
jgi:dTMP kinase